MMCVVPKFSMQPPFHLTGNPNADLIVFIVGFLVCLYWLRALRLAREGARLFLRNLVIATLVFISCRFALSALRLESNTATTVSGVVAFIVFFRRSLIRRSRHIPKSVK